MIFTLMKMLTFMDGPLLNILNEWTKAIDDDKMFSVLLLDHCKAFDLIDHRYPFIQIEALQVFRLYY